MKPKHKHRDFIEREVPTQDFGFPFSKDLQSALWNVNKRLELLNRVIKSYEYIQSIERELLNDPEFINRIEAIIAEDPDFVEKIIEDPLFLIKIKEMVAEILDKIADDDAFIQKIIDILVNNQAFIIKLSDEIKTLLVADGDFIRDIGKILTASPEFIDAVSQVLQETPAFIDAVAKLVAENETFINNVADKLTNSEVFIGKLVELLSTNETLVNALKDTISHDTEFISAVREELVKDGTFVQEVADKLKNDDEFIQSLIAKLEADADFINNLVSQLSTNETLINAIATNQGLIDTITNSIQTNQTFIDAVGNAVYPALVANDDFIEAIAQKLSEHNIITKEYVDSQDEKTLASAKEYTDESNLWKTSIVSIQPKESYDISANNKKVILVANGEFQNDAVNLGQLGTKQDKLTLVPNEASGDTNADLDGGNLRIWDPSFEGADLVKNYSVMKSEVAGVEDTDDTLSTTKYQNKFFQSKLTAGENITISEDNVISSSGGDGLWTNPTETTIATKTPQTMNMQSRQILNLQAGSIETSAVNVGQLLLEENAGAVQMKTPADLQMRLQKIVGLAPPTQARDVATKAYVDENDLWETSAGTSVRTKATATLDMQNRKITNLATPTLSTDATTKAYVDSNPSGDKYWRELIPGTIQLGAGYTAVSFSQLAMRLIVHEPTTDVEATNKKYVDDAIANAVANITGWIYTNKILDHQFSSDMKTLTISNAVDNSYYSLVFVVENTATTSGNAFGVESAMVYVENGRANIAGITSSGFFECDGLLSGSRLTFTLTNDWEFRDSNSIITITRCTLLFSMSASIFKAVELFREQEKLELEKLITKNEKEK